MPELPDIVVYIDALKSRILDRTLSDIQLTSPFLLRTAAPPLSSAQGRRVVELRRLGKRICIGLGEDLWLVLHLMIAGRLHWKETEPKGVPPTRPTRRPQFRTSKSKAQLATFQFENGILLLTEAGTQRRASLHVVEGENGLSTLDPGGVELFATGQKLDGKTEGSADGLGGGARLDQFIDPKTFARILQSENHTLKRALTDPRLFSGIGNAYSDEILWEARLSPVKLTLKLSDEELERLYLATHETLVHWIERLRAETGNGFPEKVTAFREGMAVHGRFKQPCMRCGVKIQRIRYATNETNYCPHCQTAGKLLADRALSRLLREDWPKTAEELG
jgi:formamidopyrimidine-DNA glycosylase